MIYQAPTIASRQSIDRPFVLGNVYVLSPTWTDLPDEDQA
jgi:hypothetical protein